MRLEKQKQIEDLLKVYEPNETYAIRSAKMLGMALAILTDEQAETMISYLQKWIEEK
jgi:hypothetical protein